jgi:hypothetical protein
MVFEGDCICLIDFDRELSDLGVWRERLVALGFDCKAISAEQTVNGTTVIKIQAPHSLERLRLLAEPDAMSAVH